MLKKLSIALFTALIVSTGIFTVSFAQTGGNGTISQLNQWLISGGYIKAASSTAGLWVPSLSSSGKCLITDASGHVSTQTCASGGGSGGGAWATNTVQTLTYLTTQWTALINGTATTSPSSLEVQGNKGITSYGVINAPYFTATSTTASSSFANGINLTNGCFSIGGTCISTSGIADGTFSTTSADYWDTTKSRWSSTSQAYWASLNDFATTSVNYWYTLQSKASSTLLSDNNTFSGQNIFDNILRSTTTNATTTSFFATLASTTNFFGSGLSACNGASQAVTWINGLFGCQTISAGSGASTTLLGDSNTFTGVNTINNVTSIRSTSTNATTTGNQNVGSLVIGSLNGLLKGVSGAVTTATAGTDYENPLTFSTGLSRSLNAISCVTATGAVFGCLTGADWTTFNNKISSTSLSATAPIAYNSSTGVFSWFGLATTSQPASSNILVSNGGAGVYGVATTSVSCSGSTSCTSFTAIGGAPITISSTGGTPAGSNMQIQYNNGGVFGASADFSWDNTNKILNIATSTDQTSRIYTGGHFIMNIGGDGQPFDVNTNGGLTSGSSGGNITLTSGFGSTTGMGGSVSFIAGSGSQDINGSGNGGDIFFAAGRGGLLSGNNGRIVFSDPSSLFNASLLTNAITADRSFTFPDATGTFCLTTTCSSFTYLFNNLTNWSTTTSATGTSIQLTGTAGFYASGTSHFSDITFSNATGTQATTSSFAITSIISKLLKTGADGSVQGATAGIDYAPATSGTSLQLANGSGGFSSYAGVTCTNQFLRALSGAGASTCATVANTDLTNSSITINGSSVSLGGSITVASTTLLANNNTWTGGNIFGNSTTTNATTTSLGIASIFSSILKTTATGGVVPATNGTDFSLITAQTCGAGNHFSQVTAGGIFTCTADTGGGSASTTLLADNNTFSGTNIFGAITVSSCTGCGSGGASTTLLADSNTFSGANIFTNITRSTSTQATSTNFFASILNATTALFTSFTGTNATITNATTTNLFVGTSGGTGDALTIFGATSNEWSIGYKSSNKSFSISSSTALGTNEILTILKNGFLGLFNSSPLHQLDVKGRISGQPSFDCMTLFMSQSNVTADQLGSATVGSFACEGNMFIDVNTANAGILALTTANSEGMASGTPALQIMDASIATPAANNLVFLKTQVVGSATSSLGDGIAIEATIMTPKVSNATTSVAYVPLGFSDVAITSITTTASYTLPTNGCLLTASSTPNWKLVCRKAGVTTMADTGFATSTTAFKALLVLNQTGANVYINDSLTSSATISSANLPVTWLRPTVGVGLSNGTAVAQGRLGIGNLKVWGQDKY